MKKLFLIDLAINKNELFVIMIYVIKLFMIKKPLRQGTGNNALES